MAGPSSPPDAPTPPFASPDATSDSAASSADESSAQPAAMLSLSSSSVQGTHDLVSYATLDSAASGLLEWKCKKANHVCMLMFSKKVMPSANELVTLLYVTSKHEPMYGITNMQCYWFAETVFDTLKVLFKDATQDPEKHHGGTWNKLLVPMKEGSMEEVCVKYCAAQAALEEEIKQKWRQEEERQQECEQCQAMEEATKRECKQCQAVEEERQRAEERAQVAEEERLREREQCQVV
ncbi:hypothetical protein EDC04DRAFT_2907986 [Pisolithus marmoratus]|nr:hypothetical protein EDC04DRAFT_2907986 [Pisolithus marmoratus]